MRRNWLSPLSDMGLWVKLIAAFVLMVVTGFGFPQRVELLLDQERYVTLFFYVGVWGVSLLALVIAALQPRWQVRVFWGLLLAAASTAGWIYWRVSGSNLLLMDVFSLWEARHEASRAAAQYGYVIQPAALVFLATFAIIAAPLVPVHKALRRALAWLWWAPAVPVGLIVAIMFLKQGGGSQAMPMQFQPLAVSAVAAWLEMTHHPQPRMDVPFAPKHPRKVRRIVLLVDESLRADYLDFTPGNIVTPHLPRLRPYLADFGKATSGGNCSSYSNAILRFTAQPHVMVKSATTYPTLWQWAKKAGFRTVFIDAQAGFIKDPGKLQNFMTAKEAGLIDRIHRVENVPGPQLDMKLLDYMKRELAGDEPVFIYANKNGAHFPYDAGYPEEARRFGPTISDLGRETFASKIASYRNVVAWSVDEFFHRLLREVDLKDTLIIYTSDHGQNLGAGMMTHCSTQDPDPREGLVPLLALSADAPLLARLRQAAARNRNKATHFAIAPTLLLMMGYDAADLANMYGPSLFDDVRTVRQAFSYGDIFGLFTDRVRFQPVDTSRDWLERPKGIRLLKPLKQASAAASAP